MSSEYTEFFIRAARDRVNAATTDAVNLAEAGQLNDALESADQAVRYAEDLKKQIRTKARNRR